MLAQELISIVIAFRFHLLMISYMHTRQQKVDWKISLLKELVVKYFQLIIKAWFQGKHVYFIKIKTKVLRTI